VLDGIAGLMEQAFEFQRNGIEGLDIVVTDLTLCGGDGWQLLHDLKREPRTREIPVVLLTGHHEPSLRERAEHEGCAGFFVKPCLPDELAAELRHVLERTIEHERVSTSR
jgi:CheY-like chemotaxis protein